MALGLRTEMSTGDSEFMPIVMFMAKEGRFYKRDRVGGANGFENDDRELPTGTKFVVDFGSIQVGWLHFAAGQAPSFAVVPLGQALPAQPNKDHRQGFKLLLHLGKGGGLREFATTAKTVLGAVDDLHGQFEAAPEAAAGKIPIVEFSGTQKITTKNVHGTQTNFRPSFTITGWMDRLPDFGPRTVPPPGQTVARPQATQVAVQNAAHASPTNGSSNPRHVPPPQQATTDDWNTSLAAASQANAAPAGKEWGGGGSTIEDDIPFAACWQ